MLLAFRDIDFIEVGCDEAGRGCLAGPVVASAVILPKNFKNELLNDSKKIVEKDRLKLKKIIEEEAIDFAVSFIYEAQIDEINILNASIQAMHDSLDKLSKKFNFILVDGNRFKNYKKIKHECVIKGDGKYMSIAAASILAKTYRDEYMMKLHEAHPEYNWNKSKGYPTLAHREAIKKYGPTIYHRKSFNLLGTNQLELF
jgi:ribonuclease HII